MYQIGLNTKMRDNFAFFCPDTRLHLTLTNPVGNVDRVSPAIQRGLKANTLIDLSKPDSSNADPEQDMKSDNQEPGVPEENKSEQEPAALEENESKQEGPDIFNQLEGTSELSAEDKKPAKRGKNKAAKPTE